MQGQGDEVEFTGGSTTSKRPKIYPYMTITVISIDVFNIRFIKKLNIYDSLQAYFINKESPFG